MTLEREKTDDDLMRKFQEGDVEAFEELLGRYQAPLAAFAEGLTGDPGGADDVVQETFVRVYEQRADYIPTGRFRAWIYTIARNLCRDRFRCPAPVPFNLDIPLVLWSGLKRRPETDGWAERAERSDRLRKIGQAATQLADPQKEAVMLKYYHGLGVKEIAEVQGCPVGTVKSRLHYALRRIEQMVSE